MNKKQLIVTWVMAVLICFVILFAPKNRLAPYQGSYLRVSKGSLMYDHAVEKINWEVVGQGALVILIIGGLLIYSLRDKNKWILRSLPEFFLNKRQKCSRFGDRHFKGDY